MLKKIVKIPLFVEEPLNCKQAYELLWSKNEWYNNCRKINVWYKDEQYVYVPIKK